MLEFLFVAEPNATQSEKHCLSVDGNEDGMRLDSFLAARFPAFSRAKIQRAILKGNARVDEKKSRSSCRLVAGQQVEFELPVAESQSPVPEDIELDIVFEDEHLIGINKPAGMVVHPAKGHWSGTLTAALAFHFDRLSSIGGQSRPGIVHRLDRDTSGIILVAKTDEAHGRLASQFENRTVQKTYLAIVSPPPDRDRDEINQPIGVHPYQREKMTIRSDHTTSRAASTFYEVKKTAGRFCLISVQPKTGRTHQIRVHMAHVGCPVVADRLYSGRSQLSLDEIRGDVASHGERNGIILDRQALHASSIRFTHPVLGTEMHLEAPLAPDIQAAWNAIENSVRSS